MLTCLVQPLNAYCILHCALGPTDSPNTSRIHRRQTSQRRPRLPMHASRARTHTSAPPIKLADLADDPLLLILGPQHRGAASASCRLRALVLFRVHTKSYGCLQEPSVSEGNVMDKAVENL